MYLLAIFLLLLGDQCCCIAKIERVETEPQNVTITSSFKKTKEVFLVGETNGGWVKEGSPTKDASIETRINDKLTSLHALYEQQLKRLESLEYKLTRMEVTQQERSEALRSDMRDLSRRVQNLDWLTTKSESNIEQIRSDIENIRLDGGGKQSNGLKSIEQPNLSQKIDAIHTIASSTKNVIDNIQTDLLYSINNITMVSNATKDIQQLLRGVPTKQFLNNAILGLKSQPIHISMAPQYAEVEPYGPSLPTSCNDVLSQKLGITKFQLPSKQPFFALCELHNGEPWMVIQNRQDGSVNFYKNWLDYGNGFGNLNGEFWLGLEKLHSITSNNIQQLLIILEDFDGVEKRAQYTEFAIASEKEHFTISILGKYNGTAGDNFAYHAGHKFSTFDLDNDGWKEGNCAQAHQGGWWYNACDMSNLNGRYLNAELPPQQESKGIYWNDFRGNRYSLKSAKMLIRPVVA